MACGTPTDTANYAGTFYTFNMANFQSSDNTIAADEDSSVLVQVADIPLSP